MGLKERVNDEMKAAMRARDSARLSAIRLLLAAIKQKEVDDRVELGDTQVVAIVEKLIKQRRDSIEQFSRAGRNDLAEREQFELDVLATYLPRQADAAEVAGEIDAAIAQSGAAGPQDMGKVMALLKARLAGRADMSAVSAQVRARLS